MKPLSQYPGITHSFFSLCFSCLLLVSCQQKMDVSPAVSLADSLRTVYAPDARTTDFHIHFTRAGKGKLLVEGETSSEALGQALMVGLEKQYDEIVDSFRILPTKSFADRPMGLVRIGVAPIREEPAFSSQQVTQALMGMPVRLLKSEAGWIRVQMPDNYLGWIDSNSITPLSSARHQSWIKSERILTTALHSPVYIAPSKDSATIAHLSAGALLKLDSRRPDWTSVELPDGRMGWIRPQQSIGLDQWQSRAQNSNAKEWVRTAESFRGLSYLWGGTSAYGVDCSGFTKMALYLNGFIIPRDASQQVEAGQALELDPESNIDWNQYRIGDLFFFGSVREDGSHRITHVAFHLGEGQVLHSTTWVREESLNRQNPSYNDHRRETLLKARRFDVREKQSNQIIPVTTHPWYSPSE